MVVELRYLLFGPANALTRYVGYGEGTLAHADLRTTYISASREE